MKPKGTNPMSHFKSALLLLALLAVSACTSPGRFDNDANTVDLNQTNQTDLAALETSTPGYFANTIGDRVLFAVDESTLSAEARQILQGQAGWLLDNSDYAIIVEGHADEQGTREYNLALGARRAASASEFLISQGVLASRLRTVTFGKERPIEICSEEACYAKNRRAVTVVAAGAGV